MNDATLRTEVCRVGASLFNRGYVHASAGNISVRLPQGGYLITPTDACLGQLDPARLAQADAQGVQTGGDRASKTLALHRQIYGAAADAHAGRQNPNDEEEDQERGAHPDYQALLRAVIHNPDDDLIRLQVADWLDEHTESVCDFCGGTGEETAVDAVYPEAGQIAAGARAGARPQGHAVHDSRC